MQKTAKDFLPSKEFQKRIGAILLILIVIGGISFLISKKSIFNKNATTAQPIVVKDIVENDEDRDGLADWQETLWGLDPANKDSDGDGISDSEELETIQKQLKTPSTFGEIEATSSAETRTDQFAEQIVQLVSALQGAGQLNEENQQAIIEQIVAYGENAVIEKKYTEKDISIVSSNETNLEIYIQKLNEILGTIQVTPEDVRLLIQIDPDQFELLQLRYSEAEKKYSTLAKSLLSMKVPKDIAYEHLEFINASYAIENTFSAYQLLETDPILMLQKYASLEITLDYFNVSSKNLLQRLQSLYNLQ